MPLAFKSDLIVWQQEKKKLTATCVCFFLKFFFWQTLGPLQNKSTDLENLGIIPSAPTYIYHNWPFPDSQKHQIGCSYFPCYADEEAGVPSGHSWGNQEIDRRPPTSWVFFFSFYTYMSTQHYIIKIYMWEFLFFFCTPCQKQTYFSSISVIAVEESYDGNLLTDEEKVHIDDKREVFLCILTTFFVIINNDKGSRCRRTWHWILSSSDCFGVWIRQRIVDLRLTKATYESQPKTNPKLEKMFSPRKKRGEPFSTASLCICNALKSVDLLHDTNSIKFDSVPMDGIEFSLKSLTLQCCCRAHAVLERSAFH